MYKTGSGIFYNHKTGLSEKESKKRDDAFNKELLELMTKHKVYYCSYALDPFEKE